MERLSVKATHDDDIIIFNLEGELDVYTANLLKTPFALLFKRKLRKFIVDLNHLDIIDSSGLGELVGMYKTLHKNSGKFCICLEQNPKNQPRQVFKATRTDTIIPIFETLENAQKYVAK